QALVVTLSVKNDQGPLWNQSFSSAMRTSGGVNDNATAQLTDEMHDRAAKGVRSLVLPKYVYPKDIPVNRSNLTAKGEWVIPVKP
ncbi:MAG: hypothetical protein N2C14_05010, partial [Planctomycetales bacterium]